MKWSSIAADYAHDWDHASADWYSMKDVPITVSNTIPTN